MEAHKSRRVIATFATFFSQLCHQGLLSLALMKSKEVEETVREQVIS